MSGIATAIITAAVITTAGVVESSKQSSAAVKQGAQTSADVQMAALQQQAQLAAPYTQLGQAAMPQYMALLGIPGYGGAPSGAPGAPGGGYPPTTGRGGRPGAAQAQGIGPSTGFSPTYGQMGPGYAWLSPGVPNPNFGKGPAGVFNTATGQPTTPAPGSIGGGTFTPAGGSPSDSMMQTLQNIPGYQFTLGQGLNATEAAASSLYGGGRGGGNLLQGIDQYTTGLAEQNYQQYLQDLLQPIQIGQAAAAGQAANIGSAASNLSNIYSNQANTLAGIQANETAGITRAVGGGINNYLTYQTLQNLQGAGANQPYGYGAPGTSSGDYPGGYIPPDSAGPGVV